MKALLTLGYYSYLFPDVASATKALELISKAMPVNDRLYKKEIEIDREDKQEMKIQLVPDGTRYVNKEGEVEPAGPTYVKKATPRLNGSRMLRLE